MVCFFVLSSYYGSAQKYSFRNFSSIEGLNANQVLSIFQDDDRQLWIGTTEGINFYDGIKFTTPSNFKELNKKVVYDINKIDGRIFFGTSGGLCVLEGDSLKFIKNAIGENLDYVYKTFKDSKGTIWVGTESGLKVLKNETIYNSRINMLLASESIYNIYESKTGDLWFCSKATGLIQYDGKRTKQYCNLRYPNSFVGGLLAIDDTTTWVTTRYGLHAITPSGTTLIKSPGESFYDIKRVSSGDIWITSTNGVQVYRNGKFEIIKEENGLIDNTILKVFEDKEKTLWFLSPDKGISQLINEKMVLWTNKDQKHKSATSITQKNKNEFIICNNSGVSIYNKQTRVYDTIPNLPRKDYFCAHYDKESKTTFLGCNDGIVTIHEGKVGRILPTNGPKNIRKIYDIAKRADGSLILATSGGVGIIKFNEITFLRSQENIDNYVLNINKGSDGKLYFGSDEGLLILNEKNELENYSVRNNFNVGRIRQTTNDKLGNLWIASDEGLFKQTKSGFININSISLNEVMQSIVFDDKNRLWAGLRNGFLEVNFNEKDTTTRFYSNSEGFLGNECNYSAIYCDNGEDIWFGTDNGLVIFRPRFDLDNKTSAIPELNINVNGINDLFPYYEKDNPSETPQLILPTANNQIEFSFKIVNLLSAKKIKFKYKLEGVDEDWKETPNDFNVIYSELSHGEYTFKLKVLNHPNILPQEEDQTINIFIKRPFYLQWWFILLILIILGTWLYSYFLIRRNVSLLNRQKGIILKQKGIVEEKNREIVDSINYAKRIQDAILPSSSLLDRHFNDYFVLYQPRDIVSGDFYWVEKVDDWVVFTAADCTGHGVPGAMVSLMCSNLLRKVILEEREFDPGKVLDNVAKQLIDRLQGDEEKVADGMDLTLCFWKPETNELKFSGAHNPLYLIRNGELSITKTNKQPIGYFEDMVDFTTHTIQLQKNDQVIIFSDGYKDQFGGPKNKKFGAKRFNALLQNVSSLSLEEQSEKILLEFHNWKDQEEQVDDICILSIKV